jgi:hypothetical protein
MSSPNEDGAGCCGLLLIIIIVLVALAATKPDAAAHRAAIAQRAPVLNTLLNVGELVGLAELKYQDYFFVSVMTAKARTGGEIPVAIGVFGKVYYLGDD